ncbi:Protein SUPPRESSOR OF K(+) TRANSPORT GROWTH DEFECT 1 [Capsicum chinense]|nr:Protein SUPPRESSOR OF K(+) TRANSPORT GROWTH DEFECT 1 [Capsicum chinense]
MYSNFKQMAVAYVKQAVEEDNTRNYANVFFLYMNALEYFKTHLKEKPNVKENNVAELDSGKQELQEVVILPVKFPQFFIGEDSVGKTLIIIFCLIN